MTNRNSSPTYNSFCTTKKKLKIKKQIHAFTKQKIDNTFSPLQLIIVVSVVENDISSSQPTQIQAAKIRNS